LRLYFDNNVYNRPFDDLSVPRNRDEARVVEALLEKVKTGEMTLAASFVVEVENGLSPDILRRGRVRALVGLASEHVVWERPILQRAEVLAAAGLSGRDALHLAAAERARVDCFVTCDDKLIGRARRVASRIA
jgi:predicted nucleic acid-binding protein